MSGLPFHSLSEIQQRISTGELSCKDVVQTYLKRIHASEHLNAFIDVYNDALERAKQLDDKKPEDRGELFGLVIGLKDTICYEDHPVSASSKILSNYISPYSATVTRKLLDADAIIIGRLNCDEFAMGSSNENSAFGNVLNALDNSKVPGGSSGGSVVAVQAGLCLATLGSDTGGSIRQPASFTGVVGIKPTYGRVSRYGLIAFASSFDQIGPITLNVEDNARILQVIAGKDEYDSTLEDRPVEDYTGFTDNKKYKIAYIKDVIEHEGLDQVIRSKHEELFDKLRTEGHTVEAVDFAYLDYAVPTYYVITTAEASSNLSRYDGIRYGYRDTEAVGIDETYKGSRSEGFGEEVKRRIMLGTFVLSAGYYDAYYTKAQKARRLIQERTLEILKEYDFIILPTTPTTAFDIGSKTEDPVAMYLSDIYTVQAPISGIPAISLPLFQKESMPFGTQVMGDLFDEAEIYNFSRMLMNLAQGMSS